MKLFYLIGDSIDQSLSPYIHSWIYKFLDIDADYNNKKISVKILIRIKFNYSLIL